MNCGQNWQEGTTRRAALELLGGLVIVAMIPENPVVGGTVLRRAAIQSPNYVAGTSGWIINQDGSVEFNNGVFRGSIVGGSLFIYSGAPGPGNPPVFSVVPPGTVVDPYGNTVAPVMMAGNLASSFTLIDAGGGIQVHDPSGNEAINVNPAKGAIFFYSGGAAFGNLKSSDLPSGTAAGLDAFGNAFLPGKTQYLKVTAADWRALQESAGAINWWTATSAGGPWSLVFSIALQADEIGVSFASNVTGNSVTIGESAAALEVSGGLEVLTGLSALSGGLSQTPASGSDRLNLSNGTSTAGALVNVKNTTATPGGAPVRFQGQSAGDKVLGIDVTGDGSRRWAVDSDGTTHWGPGNVSPDTTMYRVSPALLAVDGLVANVSGSGETWHDTGAMTNGWSKASGYFKYKFLAENNAVAISFQNLTPGTNADGTTIIAAANGLPAAYRPASNHRIPIYADSLRVPASPNNEAAAVVAITDGSFQIFGISTAATRCDLSYGIIPIDI